jgi:pimeloyl-ACP methyl ester carboxylesterase
MVLRYASLRSDPERYPHIKGVMSLATPYSMPESIRRRWNRWRSEPSYDEVYDESKEILKPDPHNTQHDRTILIYKARGNTYLPWHTEIYTYKTWWFLAGPEADTAKAYLKMERIKLPLLLIQGWYDDVVKPEETHKLADLAIQSGNTDVSAFYVNAGHTFEGKEEELGEIIVRWLDKRFR